MGRRASDKKEGEELIGHQINQNLIERGKGEKSRQMASQGRVGCLTERNIKQKRCYRDKFLAESY